MSIEASSRTLFIFIIHNLVVQYKQFMYISNRRILIEGCVIMKKYFLALLFILCMGSQVFAATWDFIGATPSQHIYIDNTSVRKNDDEASISAKFVNSDGSYALCEMNFKHAPLSYSFSRVEYYAADGNLKAIVDRYDMPAYAKNPEIISPDSISDRIWHLIWSN